MSLNNKYKPIHPVTGIVQTDHVANPDQQYLIGLTKREYFAAMAMQGMIMMAEPMSDIDMVIKKSIQCADELLNQLDK